MWRNAFCARSAPGQHTHAWRTRPPKLKNGAGRRLTLHDNLGFDDVADFYADVAGETDGVAGEPLAAIEDVIEIAQLHLAVDGRDHGTLFAGDERENGHLAHAAGKKTIVVRGRAAALDMAENGEPDFLLNPSIDELLHELSALTDALGDEDDAGVVFVVRASIQLLNDLGDVHAELGNDGDLRAGGDASHEGEIAAPSAHDLDDETAPMRGSGGADHVDEMDDRVESGVDPDAHVGTEEIVVDGARESDDGEAEPIQGARAGERAVSADDDDAVDAAFPISSRRGAEPLRF